MCVDRFVCGSSSSSSHAFIEFLYEFQLISVCVQLAWIGDVTRDLALFIFLSFPLSLSFTHPLSFLSSLSVSISLALAVWSVLQSCARSSHKALLHMCVCVYLLFFVNFIIAKLNTVKFVCLYVARSRPLKTNNSKLYLCVAYVHVCVCVKWKQRKNQNKKFIYEKNLHSIKQQQQRNINKCYIKL